MTPDATALAAWNAANARARAVYHRDPFAASREAAHGAASAAYREGRITLDQLVVTRREIHSW